MSVTIHPTAMVHPKAQLGSGITIGPGAIIGENVSLGDGCQIGANVIIEGWTTIGARCRIFTGAVLGTEPQDLKYSGERAYLRVGDENTIREYATLNRATGEEQATVLGKGNLLMAYMHMAHNCVIGDYNVLANNIAMAGHVSIDNHTVIGGLVALHQFIRIGSYVMIGGHSRVPKDVPPYIMCAGSPLRIAGINRVGLSRNGFGLEQMRSIEKAYRIVYRSKLNISQALAKLEAECHDQETQPFIEFIKQSERGIAK